MLLKCRTARPLVQLVGMANDPWQANGPLRLTVQFRTVGLLGIRTPLYPSLGEHRNR